MDRPADRWLVRTIVLAQFGPAFMFSGVAVALPAMGHELGLSATTLGLVETTFLASSAGFLLIAGRLADMVSRAALFRWSLFAFGVLSLALGFVSSGWVVLTLRVLQGMSSAIAGASGPALLMELVPVERRGRVFGAMMGAAYAGLALGPIAAGLVIDWFGWREVFWCGGAQILLGALPAFLQTAAGERPAARRAGSTLHLPSSALLLLAMAAVVVAVSLGEHGGAVGGWIAAAVVAFGAFLWWQPRLDAPLLDLGELRRNGRLAAALCVQLLLYLNAYNSIFMLSLFLQVAKGLDPHHAGLWLMAGSLVMASIAPSAGRLADRVRPELVAGFGTACVVVSSVLGCTLDATSAPWLVGVVLAVQGLGFGLFSSPNLSLILGALPRERSGFASAVAAWSRSLGMFSGMAVTSALIAVHFGEREVREDPAGVVSTVHSAYLVLVVTSALALVVAFSRRARR
ncbi:MAG: MFS transporter [Planctomycetota bacterium]